jgi:thiamine biosynthesis protein ThiS
MTISLNGAPSDARGATTVDELVARYELPSQGILIEHNGVALRRREWPDRSIAEGDRLEFIRVVAGG